MALLPLTPLFLPLVCELLHVLIIRLNPKGPEVHPQPPTGFTQGHTTIFELALVIGK